MEKGCSVGFSWESGPTASSMELGPDRRCFLRWVCRGRLLEDYCQPRPLRLAGKRSAGR